jgi:drug/metabolite transporter (DMT)-like permease
MDPKNAARVRTFSPVVIACLAATWFVWGSTYLAIKLALISFPPFFGMGTRFLLAGILLFGWARWRGQPLPTATQWRNGLILGTLMLGGNVGGAAYAEQSVASGLVVAFIAITPAVLAIMSLRFGARPTAGEILGIALGFFGVLLLASGSGFSASPAGLAAMIIAVLTWSLGSVLSQHVLTLAPGSMGFASQMLGGALSLMALSLLTQETVQWPPQPLALAAWLYLVFFGSLMAFTAYMVLLSRTSTTLASSYTFVNPVVGMLLGVSLGGEIVTAGEWVAVAIIVVSVTIVVFGRDARAKAHRSAHGR